MKTGDRMKLIRREAQAGTSALVSHLVFLETEWVLRRRYKLSKAEILGAFSDLMSAVDVSFEDEPAIDLIPFSWLSETQWPRLCSGEV